eukprot:785305-Lingulodinium_polyedra.AAC.1
MRGIATTKCTSERASEQLSHASCSEMRLETHSTGAAPHISQRARSMRRPPCGGRGMERAR